MKKVTFVINDDDWKLFKRITKENNSDSSKEIRKFISWYLSQHPDLCQKFKKELELNKA